MTDTFICLLSYLIIRHCHSVLHNHTQVTSNTTMAGQDRKDQKEH